VGLYPDNAGGSHLCVLTTDIAFISTAAPPTLTEVPSSSSPRKRRLAQLPGVTAQPPTKNGAPEETHAAPKKASHEGKGEGTVHPRRGRR
jgi:hypothetical protein